MELLNGIRRIYSQSLECFVSAHDSAGWGLTSTVCNLASDEWCSEIIDILKLPQG